MTDASHDIFINSDDIAFSFVFEGASVRGEIVRLGPATADEIISRHNLPDPLGKLLGEIMALAALCGASLKFKGRMIVELRSEIQNEETPLEFLVAEYNTDGALRGMVKLRPVVYDNHVAAGGSHALPELFGAGIMLITIDQGTNMERYQGQVAIDGDELSALAENYFMISEQIPSKVILTAEQSLVSPNHSEWRASGFMIQRVAGDNERGETNDLWNEAGIKFDTLTSEELLDKSFAAGDILHNLYHENNVKVFEPKYLFARCTCNREKLVLLMSRMPKEDTEFLIENDGQIHARCEFCNTTYHIDPSELKIK